MTNTPLDKDKLYGLVDQLVELMELPESIDYHNVSEIHLESDDKHGDHALSITYFRYTDGMSKIGRTTETKFLRPFNYRDIEDFDKASRP